jgi:hypothetical protein
MSATGADHLSATVHKHSSDQVIDVHCMQPLDRGCVVRPDQEKLNHRTGHTVEGCSGHSEKGNTCSKECSPSHRHQEGHVAIAELVLGMDHSRHPARRDRRGKVDWGSYVGVEGPHTDRCS